MMNFNSEAFKQMLKERYQEDYNEKLARFENIVKTDGNDKHNSAEVEDAKEKINNLKENYEHINNFVDNKFDDMLKEARRVVPRENFDAWMQTMQSLFQNHSISAAPLKIAKDYYLVGFLNAGKIMSAIHDKGMPYARQEFMQKRENSAVWDADIYYALQFGGDAAAFAYKLSDLYKQKVAEHPEKQAEIDAFMRNQETGIRSFS